MVDSSDLSVDFLGFRLENPFILASAPPTKDFETIKRGFEAGWAGAVTKSISLEPMEDKRPRIAHLSKGKQLFASQNYEMGSIHLVETWAEWIDKLKAEFPDKLVYASIFGSANIEEWRELSMQIKNTKADGLELNFSCPHADHQGKGSVIGQNPELCAKITSIVKQVAGSSKKIMPKLPYLAHPNEGFVSRYCIEVGADAIAGINTIAGLCEINQFSFEPKLCTGGKTTGGGYSGSILRPFGRLIISNIARSIDWRKYPISAMGGVGQLDSIVEYISLGANHLQVCTEVMNNGFKIIEPMKSALDLYLSSVDMTLDSIRGKALENIVSWGELDNEKRFAEVSGDCIGCGKCEEVCRYDAVTKNAVSEAGYGGLLYNNPKRKILPEKCDGCGSCYSACPADAISLRKV